MKRPEVTVLIATYKRAHFIALALEALKKQVFKDFEVLIVLKPACDGTEEILEKYKTYLNIRIVIQNSGSVVDATNLGFENAQGRIIAFVDDDAIPFPDWIEKHVLCYSDSAIGGVAGDVLPITLKDGIQRFIDDKFSEIIPEKARLLDKICFKTWCSPLEKFRDCLVYISKAGLVEYNSSMFSLAKRQSVCSLLGMGANMSILSDAVGAFRFPNSWILGLSWEQFLAWHLHNKGYRLVFNPALRVCHLNHADSISRSKREGKRAILHWTENNLLFYRLYGIEPGLSIMGRIVWLLFDSAANIKKFCYDRDVQQMQRLKSKFYSELIGLKMLVSNRLGLDYSPLTDLKKIL